MKPEDSQAEDIIPSPTVQPTRMLLQLVQNLLHLKRRGQGLNQHRPPDSPLPDAQLALREAKYVVPQSRFQVVFHLGQVEIRPRTARDEFLGVVVKVQAEIE